SIKSLLQLQGWLIVFGDVQDSAEYFVAESNLETMMTVSCGTLYHWKLFNYLSSIVPQLLSELNYHRRIFIYLTECYPPDDEPCNILVFCRPGDKHWRTKALDERYYSNNDDDAAIVEHIQSLLSFKGNLYAFCYENWNVVVDKKIQYIRSFKVQDAGFLVVIGDGDKNGKGMDCWVESVTSTHILKLDFSSLSWVLLKNLDDHVLFFCISMDDGLSRKCYSTSTASCLEAEMGLERGCLYYTLTEDPTLHIFEFEDDGTTAILPCLKLPTPWFLPTWIMMPTTVNSAADDLEENRSSGGELEDLKHGGFLDDYDSILAIAKFLHPVDYINLRLVCKEYLMLLTALNRKSASTRAAVTTNVSPWLISITGEHSICNAIDPIHNNDKAMIYLPDLPDDYVVGGMSFSSTSTSQNCVVIAMSNWSPWSSTSGYAEVSFLVSDLRNGWPAPLFEYKYDTHYRYMQAIRHDFMPCINNPVFHYGAFYCLDYNGLLGVFSWKGGRFSWKVLPKSLGQFNGIYPSFLVECDEKLLLVNLGQSGKSIGIYRLDESEMAWVKLTSLGKHAIFISYTSSFSAVPPHSCMENKIYLMRLYGERILYYSLDTCRYHCVGSNRHSSQDFHNTKEISNCTCIQPNWSEEPDD
ncbi:hypothetical protein MKX01_011039, partial [Papaver californicum]